MMQQECFDALAHLDAWMADEAVNTNLFNAPASSSVKSDPLGVVLILGAWNYNVLLTLQPLIGVGLLSLFVPFLHTHTHTTQHNTTQTGDRCGQLCSAETGIVQRAQWARHCRADSQVHGLDMHSVR